MGLRAQVLDHLDADVDRRERPAPPRRNASGRMPSTTRSRRRHARDRQRELAEPKRVAVGERLDQVHRRRADERRDEEVVRAGVQLLGAVALQDVTVSHHRDPLAERHRLGLVVRHVHRRDAEPLVQLRERGAHADAKLRVEVRERLVEQEGLGLPDDRAAHRDALALPARELRRPPVEQVGEAEQFGDVGDAPRDLVLRRPPGAQAVAEVLAHGHVRIERVALEDHGDVARPRREVGDVPVADRDRAAGHVLEPGEQPEQRRLAAARRADEHQELAVADLQGDVVDGLDRAERLRHPVERDRRHGPMV